MISHKKYSSGVFDKNNQCAVLESSFTLVKQFDCFTKDILNLMVDKLERLKDENFNRVLIPDFDYIVDGNIITYDTAFIKGWGIGTYIPDFANIVYEDVVLRDSDWTFDDYGMSNFIVEHNTDKIFAIDFQSYNYIPDRNYRESSWKKYTNFQSIAMKEIVNGVWINPAHHSLHPMR